MPRYGPKSVETWLKINGFDEIRVKHVGKLMVLITILVWYPGLVYFCRVEVYPRVIPSVCACSSDYLILLILGDRMRMFGSSFLLFDRFMLVMVDHGCRLDF